MTINKVKSNSYASVSPQCVEDYIIYYHNEIHNLISNNKGRKLRDCNKTQLNAIAAELETVHKRLNYIINGQY